MQILRQRARVFLHLMHHYISIFLETWFTGDKDDLRVFMWELISLITFKINVWISINSFIRGFSTKRKTLFVHSSVKLLILQPCFVCKHPQRWNWDTWGPPHVGIDTRPWCQYAPLPKKQTTYAHYPGDVSLTIRLDPNFTGWFELLFIFYKECCVSFFFWFHISAV